MITANYNYVPSELEYSETAIKFWKELNDFEHGGEKKVRGCAKRLFESNKDNYKALTDLVIVLNHKIWFWFGKSDSIARAYDYHWKKVSHWCDTHLKGEEMEYYFNMTD